MTSLPRAFVVESWNESHQEWIVGNGYVTATELSRLCNSNPGCRFRIRTVILDPRFAGEVMAQHIRINDFAT